MKKNTAHKIWGSLRAQHEQKLTEHQFSQAKNEASKFQKIPSQMTTPFQAID